MIEFPLRTRIDLNVGWEYTRGRVKRKWLSGDGSPAETVDLPHCWNTDDTYQFDRTSFRGHGAYRREIQVPDSGSGGAWHLCSHGFYGLGELWIDGRRAARFDGQYLGIEIPLPGTMTTGSHILAIRLDNRWRRNVLPGRRDPDFLLYGGLAGRVWLEQLPNPHLDRRGVGIAFDTASDGSERLGLDCRVQPASEVTTATRVGFAISDANGSVVAETGTAVLEDGTVSAGMTINAPLCWSPDDPNLYHIEGRLENADGAVDVVRQRFGITRAEFRPREGFFLDGERVDLHGANRHEAIPGLGNALTPELQRADARLLRDYGCNFVRLSHYPQHPHFLDACDELGILVYAEIATWKSVRSARGWRHAARRQMRELIIRDRHHPSVVLWGMGNESRSRKAYQELRRTARELDPGRPVTYAENHLYRARRQKTIGLADVWSVNYELDALDEARDASGLGLVVVSECCNHPTSIRGDEREELAQLAVIEREWEVMDERRYLAGHAVWSFTDYATEHRKRTRRQTGLFDAWRQPKMAADLVRARFAGEPFISMHCVETRLGAPASRFRTELPDPRGGGSPHRLHIFSNCDGVLLVQDDRKLASIEASPHTIIPVDLARGEIVAEGFSTSATVSRRLGPWSEPSAIRLRRSSSLPTAGEVAVVDLQIVDSSGSVVPNWNGNVRAVGTGGARVLAYTAGGDVSVTRGEGRIFVRATPEAEAPVVSVSAGDLPPATLALGAIEGG
jgi:beta-galactosidase/beta-glucuronidase